MRAIGFFALPFIVALPWAGNAQTFWLSPEVVVETGGTSHTLFTEPMLAKSGDGTLGLLWHGHWGVTTGTETYWVMQERHSDVFVSYSEDTGMTWSPTTQISDSRVLSYQGQLVGGPAKEFYCLWTSGDPVSYYRLHTAETADGGDTHTSQTFTQGDDDYDLGYFQPRMAISGANQILISNAIWKRFQGPSVYSDRYYNAYRDQVLSYRTIGSEQWTTTTMPRYDFAYQSRPAIFKNSIVANDSDIIVTSEMNADELQFPSYRRLYISRNSGIDWLSTTTIAQTPALNARSFYTASDGKSNWLLFGISREITTSTQGMLFVQKSGDVGTTWTQPQLIAEVERGVSSAVSDGNGKWLVVLKGNAGEAISYVWSGDYGETWSDVESIPDTKASARGETVVYLPNGRWLVAWADGDTVKLSRLIWGNSAVDEWMLH